MQHTGQARWHVVAVLLLAVCIPSNASPSTFSGQLSWMNNLRVGATGAQPANTRSLWLSAAQQSAWEITGASLLVPRAKNTTAESGCFQCDSACKSAACQACLAFSHDQSHSGQFCENKRIETSFRGNVAEACTQCECCMFKEHSSCDFAKGSCVIDAKAAACAQYSQTLSQLGASDPACAKLFAAINNNRFSQVCNSTCLPKYMEVYKAAYDNKCLDAKALDPTTFESVTCKRGCAPAPACVALAQRMQTEVMGDEVCKATVAALNGQADAPSYMCEGVCFHKISQAFQDLWDMDCFVCGEKPTPPAAWKASACPGGTKSLVPTVGDDNLATCRDHVNSQLAPLFADDQCQSLMASLQAGHMSQACQSPCFARYVAAYEFLQTNHCFVDSTSPTTAVFNKTVCGASFVTPTRNTTASRAGKKTAKLTATLLLPLTNESVESFVSTYQQLLLASVAEVCLVNTASVSASHVTSSTEGVSVSVAIQTTPQQAESTKARLQNALEFSQLLETLNEKLRLASSPAHLSNLQAIQPPSVEISEPCKSVHDAAANLCMELDGCPVSKPSASCCAAIVDVGSASCLSGKSVCHSTLAGYFHTACTSVVGDELGNIFNWYKGRQSKSPSNSATASISHSATPSPTISLSGVPSASSSPSPVPVFDIVETLPGTHSLPLGEASVPNTDTPYWGKREYCHSEDDVISCSCVFGYDGPNCENHIFASCPRQCMGRGSGCHNGVCACETGFAQPDCSTFNGCSRFSNCSGHGYCDCSGGACKCLCESGFRGPSCSLATLGCANNCLGHGHCTLNRTCVCDKGFGGRDCSVLKTHCQSHCSGNGVCSPANATCKCRPGFKGVDCDFVDTEVVATACRGCSGRGHCDAATGTCKCDAKYFGGYCQYTRFAHDCSAKSYCNGHGVCDGDTGACKCFKGYTGDSCEAVIGCQNHCSGHGTCVGPAANATCKCKMAWTGADCSVPKCQVDAHNVLCSGHGICEKRSGAYQCTCDAGWEGSGCAVSVPTPTPTPTPTPIPTTVTPTPTPTTLPPCGGNNCSDNGVCSNAGICDCFEGFTGGDCSATVDVNNAPSANEF